MYTVIEGGVTAAAGFQTASTAAGIKYKNRKDMAMIYSEKPCKAAGTFTTNIVKAAPVKWDQKIVKESEYAQAVVINAGIANACTGAEGMGYCAETAQAASAALKVPESAVLVASTGVIGMQLPMDKLKAGIAAMAPELSGTIESGTEAAKSIMTTDTRKKEVAVQFEIGGKTVTVGGMCKGSGMIHPNMCTMLSFVTTDIAISRELLQEALSADVKDTYNMISVDGDTSTNDTCLVLANGMAGNAEITEKNADYEEFCKALNYVNETLAKKMAGDGEGCTALFEVKVIGAESKAQAVTLSKSIITSSLTTLGVPQFDSIIVSNKAFTGKRDVLVNYVKAFFEATDALQADPDMAAQLLLDWYTENGSESSLEACRTEIETRPFVTSDEAKTITIGDSVQITGEFWVSQELLEESRFPEITKHVDDTIVREALGY